MAVVRSNNEGEYFELEMSAVIMNILIDLRGKLCGKIWFMCSNLMKLFVLKYLVKKKVFNYWYGEDSVQISGSKFCRTHSFPEKPRMLLVQNLASGMLKP